jgi:hypothetical protein
MIKTKWLYWRILNNNENRKFKDWDLKILRRRNSRTFDESLKITFQM